MSNIDNAAENSYITLPMGLTKDNHIFKGWKIGDDEKIYAGGSAYKVTANVEFTAEFEEIKAPTTFDVTFDKNGAEQEVSDITGVAADTYITLPSGLTKENATFKGWRIGNDTKIYAGGSSYKVTETVKFTAVFDDVAKYQVSYDLNGGTSTAPEATEYMTGSIVTAAAVPERAGYIFNGWLLSYGNMIINANGTFTMPATDVTLTAQWSAAVSDGGAYIPAVSPEDGEHTKAYSYQLTARKADASDEKIISGVKFVLVDKDGNALDGNELGHGLAMDDKGLISGTVNGAGEITFNVRLANYDNEWVSPVRTLTIKIAKTDGNASVTIDGWTYGETASTPVPVSETNGTDNVTYYYKAKTAEDSEYTTDVPVNAGEYTVKAVFAATDNYPEISETDDFEIAKAEIKSVDPTVTAPVAGEAVQTAIENGDGYTGEIAWTPADATFAHNTAYTAKVTLTADDNHVFTKDTTAAEGWTVSLDGEKLTLTKEYDKTVKDKVLSPVISPNGGTFRTGQAVTITCATDGATIYYTTDKTTPTADSKKYEGEFTITADTTITAIAIKDDYINSDSVSAVFTKRSTGGGGGGGSSSGGSGTSSYVVVFDSDNGTQASELTASANSTVAEPATPTKEGYVFDGWYTDKELTKPYDFTSKVSKNITLYAKWSKADSTNGDTTGGSKLMQMILTIDKKEAQVFGVEKVNDVAPEITNDRTMLPARFVAENLGATVDWDGEKQLVTIVGKNEKNEDIKILLTIGSDTAKVNGEDIKLDSPAYIKNDRTFTPIRFISEKLGATVEWKDETRQVVITKLLTDSSAE